MKIYAIGRAFVDYFFDESIDIPIKSNSPHVTSSDFEKIINQIKSCPKKNLLIESGGSVSNTAKTLAFLGHSVIFVGTIGKKSSKTVISSSTNTNDEPNPDEDGVFFVSTLKKHGVIPQVSCFTGKTGACLVAKQGEDYSVVAAAPGVSTKIASSQIDLNKIQESNLILLEGMDLNNIELNSIFAEEYKKANIPIAFCCGTPFGAKNLAEFIQINTRLSSSNNNSPAFIFANQSESSILESLKINFIEISKKQNIIFILTKGKKGCTVYFNGEKILQKAIAFSYPETTGAGDVFAAYFLHSINTSFFQGKESFDLTKKSIKKGLNLATKAATRILSVPLCNINILYSPSN